MARPCSSQVYQETPTFARTATSSRLSPGVRRRGLTGNPTSSGRVCSRRVRKNSPSRAWFDRAWWEAEGWVGMGSPLMTSVRPTALWQSAGRTGESNPESWVRRITAGRVPFQNGRPTVRTLRRPNEQHPPGSCVAPA